MIAARILSCRPDTPVAALRMFLQPGDKLWIVGRTLVASEKRPVKGAVQYLNPRGNSNG